MTTAQHLTSSKAKRERIFRTFMELHRTRGLNAQDAITEIAQDLGADYDVIATSIDRTIVGR